MGDIESLTLGLRYAENLIRDYGCHEYGHQGKMEKERKKTESVEKRMSSFAFFHC